MEFIDFFNQLIVAMSAIIAVKILTVMLKFNLVRYLETNPMVKYKIDKFFYIFNVKIYYPIFSYVLPVYCILYSLFAPDYDTLPRFTAAYIVLVSGFISAMTFRYLRKRLEPPQKP